MQRSQSYQSALYSAASKNGDITSTYKQWIANPALRYNRSFAGSRHAVTASVEAMLSVLSFSDYRLQSGNHIRLTAVMLSYLVWQRAARSSSVWIGGQKLLVLTRYRGYDPNVSAFGSDGRQADFDIGAYPTARTFLLGVRATL